MRALAERVTEIARIDDQAKHRRNLA